jgi:hypothetical protein
MKKMLFVIFGVLMIHTYVFGGLVGNVTVRADWAPNAEQDVKEYRLYRTDGVRTLIATVPHPTVSYTFSLTAPASVDSLKFVLTAVDLNNNESPDSSVASLDVSPPTPPKSLKKIK